MIRTKLAKKVLTKKEQRHLTEDANIHSIATLKNQIAWMQHEKPLFPAKVCFDCWGIARKLGIVEN